MTGPGQRDTVRQTESVQLKLQGQALLVEGTGRLASSQVVFNALAVITVTPDGGYLMRSTTLEGRTGEFPLTVSDSGFVWGFDVPGGKTRYTMRILPTGEWNEKGEFSRDGGTTWMPTLEMTLKKK